jgi:uncharacterized coiled-coil DUF342 family protein
MSSNKKQMRNQHNKDIKERLERLYKINATAYEYLELLEQNSKTLQEINQKEKQLGFRYGTIKYNQEIQENMKEIIDTQEKIKKYNNKIRKLGSKLVIC